MACRHFIVVALLLVMSSQAQSLAVMSVDFGSEFIKVAVVMPGTPMEVALNKESRRKSPNILSLRDNERNFGDPAMTIAVRYPKNAFRYVLHLLGQKFESPAVEEYRQRFPYHKLVEHDVRGTVCLRGEQKEVYCVEELVAMMLNNSRETAETFAKQAVTGAVITVPAFFGQAERRAMLYAAKLANVHVLQLIDDNVAVALNFGVFRRDAVNATEKTLMFFDMGATSTVATVVSYQTFKEVEMGKMENVPYLTVRGVGFDRTLGGLEVDFRLRDHLADVFDSQKKSPDSVRKSPRAMAKLLKEANRVKQVLSANTDHMAQIEGLLPDVDFRAKVTRADLEKMCADLFERVNGPLEQALKAAELDATSLEQVIIVGGASRVPRVQKILMETLKKSEIGKSVNSDEAAALGASFAAGASTKGFRTKRFGVKNTNIYPIELTYSRSAEEGLVKHVQRVLCNRFSVIPQKKVMNFNKFNDDFEFSLQYGNLLHISKDNIPRLGPLNLTSTAVTGVGKLMAKHGIANFKTVKAQFSLDHSGVLITDRVEALFNEPRNATSSEKDADDVAPLVKHYDLQFQITRKDIPPMPKTMTGASKKRLQRLAAKDEERMQIGKARNSLETRLIELQAMQCSKDDTECDTVAQKLSDLGDWLYGDGADADLQTLQQKLKKLKRISNRAKKHR